MDWTRLLYSFKGRINRAKYWLAGLVILCWMILALWLLAAIGALFGIVTGPVSFDVIGISASIQPAGTDSASGASLFSRFATIPLTLLFAWVYAAVTIKRLHDRNKSGWWLVPFIVATGLHSRFEDWLGDSWTAALIGLAVFIVFIWGIVEMYCLKGTRGPNRFGPDPLVPRDTRPHWDQQSEIEMTPHKAGPPPIWYVKREA